MTLTEFSPLMPDSASSTLAGFIVSNEDIRPLFVVADLSRVVVVAQVSSQEAADILPGTVAEVAVPSLSGGVFRGESMVVTPADEREGMVELRISLDNEHRELKLGMTASVSVRKASRLVLILGPARVPNATRPRRQA